MAFIVKTSMTCEMIGRSTIRTKTTSVTRNHVTGHVIKKTSSTGNLTDTIRRTINGFSVLTGGSVYLLLARYTRSSKIIANVRSTILCTRVTTAIGISAIKISCAGIVISAGPICGSILTGTGGRHPAQEIFRNGALGTSVLATSRLRLTQAQRCQFQPVTSRAFALITVKRRFEALSIGSTLTNGDGVLLIVYMRGGRAKKLKAGNTGLNKRVVMINVTYATTWGDAFLWVGLGITSRTR